MDFSKQGTRVILVSTSDTINPINPGDRGTIWATSLDGNIVWMTWDNGDNTPLIEGRDQWDVIKNEEVE